MEFVVYTAGPISDESAAAGWRRKVAAKLGLLSTRTSHRIVVDATSKLVPGLAEEDARSLMERDRFDIRRSDLIIANLLDPVVHIGTLIELGWAQAYGKPVVAAITPESPLYHNPLSRMACGFIVPDLESAAKKAFEILIPAVGEIKEEA